MKSKKSSRNRHRALETRQTLIAAGIIIIVALIAYSNSWQIPFQFDDFANITGNASIQGFGRWAEMWKFNGTRMVTLFTFVINFLIGGLDPFGYHVFNFVIHTLASLAVFRLSTVLGTLEKRRMGRTEAGPVIWTGSLLAAILFVAHPLQTQAVVYSVQRAVVLAALFGVLAMLAYIHSLETYSSDGSRSRRYYALTVLSLVTAMFSKETAGLVPVALVAIEVLWFKDDQFVSRDRWARRLFLLAMVLIVPVATVVNGRYSADIQGFLHKVPTRWQYFQIQIDVLRHYLGLFVWPMDQALDCDIFRDASLTHWRTLLSLGLHLGLVTTAFWMRKRNSLFAFGVFFFYLMHAVESSIFPLPDVRFEHRMYVPLIGLVLAIGSLVTIRGRVQRWAPLMAVLLSIPLIVLTFQRNKVWRSSDTLWGDSAIKCPQTSRAHLNYGRALHEHERYPEAIAELEKAFAIEKSWSDISSVMAMSYQRMGNLDEALKYAKLGFSLDENHPDASYVLGVVYDSRGELDLAREYYQRATERPGRFQSLAFQDLASAYERRGQLEQAAEVHKRLLQSSLQNGASYVFLGTYYASKGQFELAEKFLVTALDMVPGQNHLQNNLAYVYEQLGKYDEAIRSYRIAATLSPDRIAIRLNLASVLVKAKHFEEAMKEYHSLPDWREDSADSILFFGHELAKAHHSGEALSVYEKFIAKTTGTELFKKYQPALDSGLAQVYFDQNNYPLAKKHIDRSVATGYPISLDLLKSIDEAVGKRGLASTKKPNGPAKK